MNAISTHDSVLCTIYLHGRLRELFGESVTVPGSTVSAAVRNMLIIKPEMRLVLEHGEYRVVRGALDGGIDLDVDMLHMRVGPARQVHLFPLAAGAGGSHGGTLKSVVGALLIVTAVAVTVFQPELAGFTTPAIASYLAGSAATIGLFGASLLLGGIARLISPQPGLGASYLLNANLNTVGQGVPVPLVYGTTRVGSIMVATSYSAEDYTTGTSDYEGAGAYYNASGGFSGYLDAFDTGNPLPSGASGKGGGGKSGSGGVEAPNTLESKAIVTIVDVISEGPITGLVNGPQGIFFNNTPLMNADGTWNFRGVTFTYLFGTPDQQAVPGFPSATEDTVLSQQCFYGNPLIQQLQSTTATQARVTIELPALYATNTQNGDINPSTLSLKIEVAEVTGTSIGAYSTVTQDVINGKCTAPYQKSYVFDLPGAGGTNPITAWNIRLTKLTQESAVSTTINQLFWYSYDLITNNLIGYEDTAAILLQIDSEAFGSTLPARTYLVEGITVEVPANYNPATRVYSTTGPGTSGGSWDYATFSVSTTSNPAWILYDFLKNSRYGLGISSENLETIAIQLYEIAQYCDGLVPDGNGATEPRYQLNGVFNQRATAFQLMQAIAATFRGQIYWAGGQVCVACDMPMTPIKLYTAANVIDGNFTYQGTSLKTRHTMVNSHFTDPSNQYLPGIEPVELPAEIALRGIVTTDILGFGVTSRGLAHRLGNWLLYTENFQTETITFSVSWDSAGIMPGNLVLVADPAVAGIRMGGRLKSGSTVNQLILDQPFSPVGGQSYSVNVILEDGSLAEAVEIASFTNATASISPYSVYENLITQGALSAPWTFTRNSIGTYTDFTGTLQTAAANTPRFDHTYGTPSAVLPLSMSSYTSQSALPAGLTWFRSTTGTFLGSNGLIQSAAVNTPRFDYTTGYPVLLSEVSDQNLIPNSQSFTSFFVNSSTDGTPSVTENAAIAPDGTTTAALLSVALNSQLANSFTVPTAGTYVFSAFFKQGTSPNAKLQINNSLNTASVTLVFATGVASVGFGTCTAGVVQYPSGWYRLYMTINLAAGSATQYYVGASSTLETVYMWGLMLSPNGVLTSYIPTSGSEVTRAADMASLQQGLLMEGASQNLIRNTEFVGSVVGTVGSGGAFPTHWGFDASNGIVAEIVDTGTLNGLPYIDINFSGTSTANYIVMYFDVFSPFTSADMCFSSYVAISGGSSANIENFNLQIRPDLSAVVGIPMLLTSSLQKFYGLYSKNSSDLYCQVAFDMTFTSATAAINVTIRFAGLQFEPGYVPTSWIPTSGSVVSRAQDQMTLTAQNAGLLSATGFTALLEAESNAVNTTSSNVSTGIQASFVGSTGTDTLASISSSAGQFLTASGVSNQTATLTSANRLAASFLTSGNAGNNSLNGSPASAGSATAASGTISSVTLTGNANPSWLRQLAIYNYVRSTSDLTKISATSFLPSSEGVTGASYSIANLSSSLLKPPLPAAIYIIQDATITPTEWQVMGVTETSTGIFEIVAAQYNPAKYALVEDVPTLTIPVFSTVPSQLAAPLAPPTNVSAISTLAGQGVTTLVQTTCSWQAPVDSRIVQYQVSVVNSEGTTVAVLTPTGSSVEIDNLAPDTYYFAVRSLGTNGSTSSWAYSSPLVVSGTSNNIPPAVTNLTAVGGVQTVQLTWTASTQQDVLYYLVWRSSTTIAPEQPGSLAALIGTTSGTAFADVDSQTLSPGTTWNYWVQPLTSTQVQGVLSSAVSVEIAYITMGMVGPGSITLPAFVTSIQPVGIWTGAALPTSQGQVDGASSIYWSVTGQLYTWNSTSNAFVAATPTAATLTGTLTASQIATITAAQITGTLVAAQIASVNASAISGTLQAAQIASVAASQITGTLASSQIAGVSGSVVSGTLPATVVNASLAVSGVAIPTTKLSGTIISSQIASVNATAISGQLTAAQVASISAEQITGAITSTQIGPNAVTTGAILAGAVTTAQIATGTIQASNIATGTITANLLQSGSGSNSIWNSCATLTPAGWLASTSASGTAVPSLSSVASTSPYFMSSMGALKIAVTSAAASQVSDTAWAPNSAITANYGAQMPVTPGARYEFQLLAISDTASITGQMHLIFFNSTGGTVASYPGSTVTLSTTNPPASYGDWTALSLLATAPAGSSVVAIFFRTANAGSATVSYNVYATQALFGQTNPNATVPSNWTPGGVTQISGGQIISESITATQILAGTITANQIATGTITALQIATGTITASNIAAGAITASSLTLTDLTNICGNPLCTSSLGDGQAADGWLGVTSKLSTDSGVPASAPAGTVGLIAARDQYYAPGGGTGFFPVIPGESYYLYCQVAGSGTFPCSIGLNFQDASGNNVSVSAATVTPSSTWQAVSGQLVVPPTVTTATTRARIWVNLNGTSGFGNVYFTNVVVRKAASAELLVDGSITATQIQTGTITTAQIATGTIQASNIAAGAITTALLAVGSPNNVIWNSCASITDAGWEYFASNCTLTSGPVVGSSYASTWYLSGGSGYMAAPSFTSSSEFTAIWVPSGSTYGVPVVAGQYYAAQVALACSGLTGRVVIAWYNSAGTLLSEVGGTPISTTATGGTVLSEYTVSYAVAEAPAGACWAQIQINGYGTSSTTNPILVWTQALFGQVGPSTVGPVIWTPGGVTQIAGGQIITETITAEQLAIGTITATQIATGSITTLQLATGTLSASNITAGTLNAGVIIGSVANLGTVQITNANIANLTVQTSNIVNNAITDITSGTGTSTFSFFVAVPAAGYVVLILNSAGTIYEASGGSYDSILFQIKNVTTNNILTAGAVGYPDIGLSIPVSLSAFDQPGGSTYQYEAVVTVTNNSGRAVVNSVDLIALVIQK